MENARPLAGGGGARQVAEMLRSKVDVSPLAAMQSVYSSGDSTENRQQVYMAMAVLAEGCLERAMTETAVDILAFLLQQSDLSSNVSDTVEEMFSELESRICPRVVYDAREFAHGMDVLTMVEYLLGEIEQLAT